MFILTLITISLTLVTNIPVIYIVYQVLVIYFVYQVPCCMHCLPGPVLFVLSTRSTSYVHIHCLTILDIKNITSKFYEMKNNLKGVGLKRIGNCNFFLSSTCMNIIIIFYIDFGNLPRLYIILECALISYLLIISYSI